MEQEKQPKKRGRKKRVVENNLDNIIYNDLKFIPSKYQKDIFDFMVHGVGNAVVKAVAGSGKTTTATNAIKLIPEKLRCLFIAFNRDIVGELSSKLKDANNVDVRTVHSLGLLMIRRNFQGIKNIEIDEFKYRTFIKKNIGSLTDLDSKTFNKREYEQYIDNVCELVNLGRLNLCQCEKEFLEVAGRHDLTLLDDECETVLKVMKWGSEHIDTIDYTDMIWLPYELSLKPIGLQYDWIFIDECQDLNNAQRELFLRCFKRGTRFVAIGDDSQAIYSFCGASPESFKKLQNLPNTTTLPLSVSYRCSKNVINFAKNIVPEIEAKEDAVDGEVVFNAHIKDIQKGDMVLCRNKMPLIKLYMRFLRMGIKSFIRGQDIGLNLLKMVNATDKRELNVDLKKDGVFVRLYERLFEARNKLMIKRGLDIQDASTSDVVMSMYDSIKALEILSENIKTADELILRINNVFMEDADSICLSTIHKAKGLEAKNVFILCKSLMPSKMAKQDWELEQERNLEYVAYTRAKEKLAFVNEKEVSPNAAMIDVSAALTELAYVEKTICKVLGKTPITEMSQEDAAKYAISIATELKPVEKTNSVKLDDTSNNEEEEKSDEEMMMELMKIVKKKGGLSKLKKLLNE